MQQEHGRARVAPLEQVMAQPVGVDEAIVGASRRQPATGRPRPLLSTRRPRREGARHAAHPSCAPRGRRPRSRRSHAAADPRQAVASTTRPRTSRRGSTARRRGLGVDPSGATSWWPRSGDACVGFGALDAEAGEVTRRLRPSGGVAARRRPRLLAPLETIARLRGVTTARLDASLNAVDFYAAAGWRRERDTDPHVARRPRHRVRRDDEDASAAAARDPRRDAGRRRRPSTRSSAWRSSATARPTWSTACAPTARCRLARRRARRRRRRPRRVLAGRRRRRVDPTSLGLGPVAVRRAPAVRHRRAADRGGPRARARARRSTRSSCSAIPSTTRASASSSASRFGLRYPDARARRGVHGGRARARRARRGRGRGPLPPGVRRRVS